MDPIVALYDWLNGDSTAGGDYSEWVARGGVPAVIELGAHTPAWMMGDRYATVISVSRNHAQVVYNTSGKKGRVLRENIYRVTLA